MWRLSRLLKQFQCFTGVVCHQLSLLSTDLHAVGCGGFAEGHTENKLANIYSSVQRSGLNCISKDDMTHDIKWMDEET